MLLPSPSGKPEEDFFYLGFAVDELGTLTTKLPLTASLFTPLAPKHDNSKSLRDPDRCSLRVR